MTTYTTENGTKILSYFNEGGDLKEARMITNNRRVIISKSNTSDNWSIYLEKIFTNAFNEVEYLNLRSYSGKSFKEAIEYWDKKLEQYA